LQLTHTRYNGWNILLQKKVLSKICQEKRMMTRSKPLIVYIISVLMLGATALRGLLQAFETGDPNRWLIAGLMLVYGVFLFSEAAIIRRFPVYLYAYFVIQTIITVILILLPLYPPEFPQSNDFFALLFIPLCVQAIIYFRTPRGYYWVIALTASSITALFLQYGASEGIQFAVTYILGYTMLCFLAIFYINSEDAKNELNLANQKLQEYAKNAEALAVAEERNRLARDLHDSVTQALYSLTLFAEAAHEELAGGDVELARGHIKDLRETSRQALQEMRLMIFELRPPELETKGFLPALQERLDTVEARTGIQAIVNTNIEGRLPSKIEFGLYSIAREALNNILKHSQATQVDISLSKMDGSILFEIQDNGVGLDALQAGANSGLGIKGMKERADQIGARLTLQNIPERGTLLKIEVPDDGND